MNKYILDTDIVSYLWDKKSGITAKDAKKNDLDLVIASIVMGQEAILISNDGIFKRLAELEPKFKYESWLK